MIYKVYDVPILEAFELATQIAKSTREEVDEMFYTGRHSWCSPGFSTENDLLAYGSCKSLPLHLKSFVGTRLYLGQY